LQRCEVQRCSGAGAGACVRVRSEVQSARQFYARRFGAAQRQVQSECTRVRGGRCR